MIPTNVFKDKTVALFGLGGSGIVTAQAMIAGGVTVVGWDDNPESVARAAQAGIVTQDLRLVDWTQFSALILAPGVPLTHPKPHWSVDLAHEAGVEIIGDVELFSRELQVSGADCPFIAITGTNGKSTTTALIAHIIKASGRDMQLGGNIGTAVLSLEQPANGRNYVVECSSYQIDLAPSLCPTAGILLNLTPDHLDRHGTMEHYAAIKQRLVAGSDTAIIAIDDGYCITIADQLEQAGKAVVRLSKNKILENGYYAQGSQLYLAANGKSELLASLDGIGSLRGEHNAQNALAAIAACQVAGLTIDQIRHGLISFPGLAHRMEQIGYQGKTLFINDSKATNAEAAATALAALKQIYWIVGGLPKEGGIESLREFYPHITKAYLIGEAAPAFAAVLGEDVAFEISGTLDAAVEHAARDAAGNAAAEPVVLLSPACASFDQFPNFEKRGEAFCNKVRQLDNFRSIERVG